MRRLLVAVAMVAALLHPSPAGATAISIFDWPISVSATEVEVGDQITIQLAGMEETYGISIAVPSQMRIDSAHADGVACSFTDELASCAPAGGEVELLEVVATAVEPGYRLLVSGGVYGRFTPPGVPFPVEVSGTGSDRVHIVGDLVHHVGLDAVHCAFVDQLVTDFGFADAGAAVLATTEVAHLLEAAGLSRIVFPRDLPLGSDCTIAVLVPGAQMIEYGDGTRAWALSHERYAALSVGTTLAIIAAILSGTP